MRIGVVLVNWNTAALTADCVRSLLAAERRPDRILVVDNGSAPADRALLDSITGIDRIDLPENTGFTGANNRGIETLLADGFDLIWILNNDTLVDTACLRALEAHLTNHPKTGAATAKIYFANPPTRLWYAGGTLPLSLSSRHRGVFEEDRGQYDTPGATRFLCGCCMLVRAEVFRRVGAFHPAYFAYFEDTEWSLRAAAAGVRMDYVPAATLRHRVGSTLIRRDGSDTVGGRAECLIFRNWIFTIRLHARGLRAAIARAAVARHAARRLLAALLSGRRDGATAIRQAIREGWTTPLPDDPARALRVVVVGQTPPPWGGQAVMIRHLLDTRMPGVALTHVRMAFSEDMDAIGRFRGRKLLHLASVIARIVAARARTGAPILYYPPAGPNRVPAWRDFAILGVTRWMFRRTVFHFHASGLSTLPERLTPVERALFRLAYRRPDVAIQTSDRNPADGAFLDAKRTIVVENGVDDVFPAFEEDARRERAAPHPPRVLFVGALYESKGAQILVEALTRLRARGIAFEADLVGRFESPAFERTLREAATPLGDGVRFPGVLTGDDKWRAYARADIFCFPSHFDAESFGLVNVEAMMFALPVVSTFWRGIPAVVRDGKTGFLVPIRNPAAVADKLALLLEDRALRERMGAAGRRAFTERFRLDRWQREMTAVFHELAAGSPAP